MPEEVKDLRSELSSALDAVEAEPQEAPAEAPVEAAPEAPAAAPEKPAEPDGRVRDEHGRFVARTEKPAEAAKPAETAKPAEVAPAKTEGQEQTQQQGVDLPPSTWTAAAKAEWSKLPAVVKSEFKKREADFQKGITQYKAAAEFGGRLSEVLRPYEAIIRSKGGSPEAVVGNLLATAYALQTGTPQERGAVVMKIVQQYGADISAYTKPAAAEGQPGIDPNALAPVVQQLLAPHLQKIEQVSSQFMSAQQRRELEEQQTLASQIEAFRNATDDKGQPKHVYFENVRKTMAALIDSGDATTLEQAYEMACRAHPEVSQAISAQQRQAEEAKRLEEQKRLAQDAQRANTANASGQGSVGLIDTSKVSLRDELGARLEGRIA